MSALLDAANALATAIPVRAYTDPADAVNNRPCLLVVPPVLDWQKGTLAGNPEVTWTLIALSSYTAGQLAALVEIQDLIDAANQAVSLERAEPIQYQLKNDSTRIAAYRLTTTDYL